MAVTPSGLLSLPLDALADLLAGTDAFQAWTGAATAAAAKERIHPHAVCADPNDASYALLWPYAVINWAPGLTISWGGYARGPLSLIFESAVSTEYQRDGDQSRDYKSAAYEHLNQVGAVLQEAYENSEASGSLILDSKQGFRLLRVGRPTEAQLANGELDFYQSIWEVNWGIRA